MQDLKIPPRELPAILSLWVLGPCFLAYLSGEKGLKWMKEAVLHFKRVDLVLYKACLKVGFFDLQAHIRPAGYFEQLAREIVGQQLSGKAAKTIWDRFVDLLPENKVIPENVLRVGDEDARSAGMSRAKIKYVKNLAQRVASKELNLEELKKLKDEDVIKELVRVKGIGPWTAEMFLMFTLGREDVFSFGDLGLKNAVKRLYNLENPTTAKIKEISRKWSPYRTYASRILWKSLEA